VSLPFTLPYGRLAVIMPRPKVHPNKQADGVVTYEAIQTRQVNLRADRNLFRIGFMLEIEQFAQLSAAERFTLCALLRLLVFNNKLDYPDLSETGELYFVENSNEQLVWATISNQVIVTKEFTVYDLRDQRMATDERDALRETIEVAVYGCQDADVDVLLERFDRFTTPHETNIRSALKHLKHLGIVREYIRPIRGTRRAVFNMRLIGATRSFILQGMIAAETYLKSADGSVVSYSSDISTAEPPVKRAKSTKAGRRRKKTRAEYQSEARSEHRKRIKAERDLKAALKKVAEKDDQIQMLNRENQHLRDALDPRTEIPAELTKKGKRHG